MECLKENSCQIIIIFENKEPVKLSGLVKIYENWLRNKKKLLGFGNLENAVIERHHIPQK